jgi:anti-anti-sigma factor
MALKICKRVEDGFGILSLEGSLTLGPSLHALRHDARELLSKPELTGIILDVEKITSVDSSGLSELTIVYSDVSKQHRLMRLVGVSTSLCKMLKMTHLDVVLESADQLGTAKRQMRASA